jgi:flagellin
MIINHNMSAIFAENALRVTSFNLNRDIQQLSSGLRINSAADDPSGLAVSEKMRSQIQGLQQASRNAQNGISFIQTAEGYLAETESIIHRLRDLAVQASNGIYTAQDRTMIQVEVSQLVHEVNRIASQAQFNGLNMLTGRFARPTGTNTVTASMWFHIGANMDQRIRVYIGTMSATALGLEQLSNNQIMSLSSPNKANAAIGVLDSALNVVNKQRADLGAYQNRLQLAVQGLNVGAQNMQAAESQIRDANVAKVMVDYTKNQILLQAGMAMLAQANAKDQTVLQLFK